jgi:hypothetical protein
MLLDSEVSLFCRYMGIQSVSIIASFTFMPGAFTCFPHRMSHALQLSAVQGCYVTMQMTMRQVVKLGKSASMKRPAFVLLIILVCLIRRRKRKRLFRSSVIVFDRFIVKTSARMPTHMEGESAFVSTMQQ